jgi:hypothetical protein
MITRPACVMSQRVANFLNATLLGCCQIRRKCCRAQLLPQGLTTDDLPGPLDDHQQQAIRRLLQLDPVAIWREGAGVTIEFEGTKTEGTGYDNGKEPLWHIRRVGAWRVSIPMLAFNIASIIKCSPECADIFSSSGAVSEVASDSCACESGGVVE